MSSGEEVTQYLPQAPALPAGPVRVSVQVTGPAGEVLFAHQCQEQGTIRDLARRLWHRNRGEVLPRCAFFGSDNPSSTWVFQCQEHPEDGTPYFLARVPGGFLRVLVCAGHRVMLEQRERAYYGG